ncbi:hypothetical protein ABT288_30895 [Streptomyces sp. NPDC001093]|uniref:hypothetical protein n=1 Tax=Streptomyces sp. NPDC001093 TaxID=3154376 RepID=UPI0033215992
MDMQGPTVTGTDSGGGPTAGDRDGTRALIEVLLLGRRFPHEHLVPAARRHPERGR